MTFNQAFMEDASCLRSGSALQILFTIKVSGDVTIRLNDKSQSSILTILLPWTAYPLLVLDSVDSFRVVDLLGMGTSAESALA